MFDHKSRVRTGCNENENKQYPCGKAEDIEDIENIDIMVRRLGS
jgi:hypothetical protein